MTQWWQGFFTPGNFPLERLVDPRATAREVRALKRLLRGRKRVLDVACGAGRHANPLARAGFEVTGLDWSSGYLEAARRGPARYVRGDMRRLPFSGEFDAALCLWTSFGYFDRLADDRRALRSMRRALKPGGLLLLEVVEPPRAFAEFGWHRLGGVWSLERTWRRRDGLAAERWYISPDGKASGGRTFVRLYGRGRLAAELRRAGFTTVTIRPGLGPRRILAAAVR